MTRKAKPAGGNRRAVRPNNTFIKQHSGIDCGRATCIHQILNHDQKLAPAKLRARVRDWCTRTALLKTIAGPERKNVIRIKPSVHGPLIVLLGGLQLGGLQ